MKRDFYVYSLHDPRKDFALEYPRYVGMGSGTRAISNTGRQRSKRVKEWIADMGVEPFFDLIAANLTEADACVLEIETIAKYGREGIDPGGTLLNVALGGPGARGVKLSDERRAKLSAVHRGKVMSAESRAKMREAQAARSPEERSAAARAREAAKTPEERSAAASRASKAMWAARRAAA
jgi:hypothetical protein